MSRQGSLWSLLARQKQPSEEAPLSIQPFTKGILCWIPLGRVWEAAMRIVFPKIHQQKNGFGGCTSVLSQARTQYPLLEKGLSQDGGIDQSQISQDHPFHMYGRMRGRGGGVSQEGSFH